MAVDRKTVVFLVALMLVTGSINTVTKSLGYKTCSKGLNGVDATDGAYKGCPKGERNFQKPITQTFVVFLGECMCGLIFFAKRFRKKTEVPTGNKTSYRSYPSLLDQQARLQNDGDSGDDEDDPPSITWGSVGICFWPAVFDLAATTMSGTGLLFTSPSVFQMLRGSIIVFTALLSVVFLKRRLKPYEWFGIFVTVIGIVVVGVSSYLDNSKKKSSYSTATVMFGNLLIVLSQIISAAQFVVEEKFVKKRNLPSEFVVACEGFLGALFTLVVFFPLVYYLPFGKCSEPWCKDGQGLHEDPLDAAVMLSNNGFLLFLVLFYWVSTTFYNFSGLEVAKKLTAVHRTLVDASRTVVVWAVDLILFYTTNGAHGEEWDTQSGLIQLLGFAVMLYGTFLYNGMIRHPCIFKYPIPSIANPSRGSVISKRSSVRASVSYNRSSLTQTRIFEQNDPDM